MQHSWFLEIQGTPRATALETIRQPISYDLITVIPKSTHVDKDTHDYTHVFIVAFQLGFTKSCFPWDERTETLSVSHLHWYMTMETFFWIPNPKHDQRSRKEKDRGGTIKPTQIQRLSVMSSLCDCNVEPYALSLLVVIAFRTRKWNDAFDSLIEFQNLWRDDADLESTEPNNNYAYTNMMSNINNADHSTRKQRRTMTCSNIASPSVWGMSNQKVELQFFNVELSLLPCSTLFLYKLTRPCKRFAPCSSRIIWSCSRARSIFSDSNVWEIAAFVSNDAASPDITARHFKKCCSMLLW